MSTDRGPDGAIDRVPLYRDGADGQRERRGQPEHDCGAASREGSRLRPRLGLVVPGLEHIGGGITSVARFLKDTAMRHGYELTLVSLATSAHDECNLSLARPSTWPRGAVVSHGTWDDLPVVHVGAIAGEPEFRRYLPRRVLAEALAKCDILQVVCGSPAYANAVCGMGKPVSVHCATRARVERRRRDANPRGCLGWWRKAMTEFTDRVDDQVLRSADGIQVMNPWMYDYARTLNEGRDVDLRYAPPGVDAVTFCPGHARRLAADPYVLCVGRLDDPRKNVGLLFEAYLRLPETIRDGLRVVLAGNAEPPASFWHRVAAAGLRRRIEFLKRPSRAELVALYQNAAMFVLPSDEEGFGVVLVEAMACGIPVISTRSGGPEGIITDAEDGYLVPLDDAVTMSSLIAQLHSEPRLNRAIGQRARATVEQRYGDDVAGEPFLDVWERLGHKSGWSSQCAV